MAAKSRSEIIGDFEDFIGRNGNAFGEFYVGCTGNPKVALFTRHALKQSGEVWISRRAKDEYEAGEVVEYFVTSRKTKGRRGERKEEDVYVYAFKIRSHTRV